MANTWLPTWTGRLARKSELGRTPTGAGRGIGPFWLSYYFPTQAGILMVDSQSAEL